MRNIVFIAGMAHQMSSIEGVRHVLDAVARRIGPSAWHARLTDEMLESVRMCLVSVLPRKAFVAAHEISGFASKRMRLLWLVGRRSLLDREGSWVAARKATGVPRALRTDAARRIAQIAYYGGLAHDVGKNTEHFMHKLHNNASVADPKRHEVVSVERLRKLRGQQHEYVAWLAPVVGTDQGRSTSAATSSFGPACADVSAGDDRHLSWVEYLALSHHRLPHIAEHDGSIDLKKNAHIKKTGGTMDERPVVSPLAVVHELINNPSVMRAQIDGAGEFIYSRLALMLADHYVSSLGEATDSSGALAYVIQKLVATGYGPAMANRRQPLAGHIQAVARVARSLAPRMLNGAWMVAMPHIEGRRLASIASREGRFAWQGSAVDTVAQYAAKLPSGVGGLVFVGASTGSGKTRACAAIAGTMCGDKARLTVALGLRTLTLQTYRSYRSETGLREDEVDLVIGSRAYKDIHLRDEGIDRDEDLAEEELITTSAVYAGDCALLSPIQAQFHTRNDRRYIGAPVIVCTIDQIMKAADHRRSSWIRPWLRIISSGALIIDEIDSFGHEDCPALLRLIYFAALAGVHVILSSATIYPALARHMMQSWKRGTHERLKLLGQPGSALEVAMIGDSAATNRLVAAEGDFAAAFRDYASNLLAQAPQKRMARVIGAAATTKAEMRAEILEACLKLHAINAFDATIDSDKSVRLSVGMIKLLHVREVIAMAQELVRFCSQTNDSVPLIRAIVYHSRNTMIARSYIEQCLDDILKRKDGKTPVNNDQVYNLAKAAAAAGRDACIIVLTTLEEVGQDHDYDWAVIEPASARGIVQTAGRVLRHRDVKEPRENIAILDRNFRCLENESQGKNRPCFVRPGFERETYSSHRLSNLLNAMSASEMPTIDARMCLLPATGSLGDLDDKSIDAWLDESFRSKWINNPYAPISSGHYSEYGFRRNAYQEYEFIIDYKNNLLTTRTSQGVRQEPLSEKMTNLLGSISLLQVSWREMEERVVAATVYVNPEMRMFKTPKETILVDAVYGAVYDRQ